MYLFVSYLSEPAHKDKYLDCKLFKAGFVFLLGIC